jgi:hypothetical protein
VVAATGAELTDEALEPLAPRADPADVAEVLAWAPHPLATVEVAAICRRAVREELESSGARFEAVDGDGYWSLG